MKSILDPLRTVKQKWDGYRLLHSADALFISFPKCGRTWVRSLLGKTFQIQFNLPENIDLLEIERLYLLHKDIPKILFLHDDEPFWKTPSQLATSKNKYRHKKTIFLVRHPADVLVSAYFEKTKRYVVHGSNKPDFEGSLKDFIYSPIGSTDTLLQYYNIWAKESRKSKHFLLLHYENMHKDALQELLNIIRFLNLEHIIGNAAIEDAVAHSTFERMQQMEKNNAYRSFRLMPGDVNDIESYKTRRGIIGGYIDYLEPAEIAYIAHKVNNGLDKLFGYSM